MKAFLPGRNQDASPTIRGFRYQIQLTLARWLDLGTDEILILECGEDVDRIVRADDQLAAFRELEQIKIRSRGITLRSPEARTALANFAAHLARNPDLRLLFRFTTTAMPGREHLSPLSSGSKGIEEWERLRTHSPDDADTSETLAALARLIEASTRPDGCGTESWDHLLAITGDQGPIPFREYVQRFEWCCGQASPEELEQVLVDRLNQLEGVSAPDDPSGEQRYEQLMARLLALLAQPGEKRLSQPDLNRVFEEPTLTEQDRKRLALLETASLNLEVMLQDLQATLEDLQARGLPPVFFGDAAQHLVGFDPSLSLPAPPPLVERLARRPDAVTGLAADMKPPCWLVIHGPYGIGKSHLARLLAESLGGVALGLSMRGLDAGVAERAFQALLTNAALWADLSGPDSGVILADDLPEVAPRSRLELSLLLLARRAADAGYVFITTACRQLPLTTTEQSPFPVSQSEALPFGNDDAAELFRAHGVGPALITSQRVAGLNYLCHGHPVLLTALARYLADHQREPDQALVDALTNEYRQSVDLETARTVLETIEDTNCRELLYRLASVRTPLSHEEIQTIASAPPAVTEPIGCVARLDGLWLRRTSEHRFDVSPLILPLGSELTEPVTKAIHGTAAITILRRGTIGVGEFLQAITSFLIAGNSNAAAMALVQGYTKAPAKLAGFDAVGVLHFFPPDHVSELSPTAELPLRAVQAVTAVVTGVDHTAYVQRIDSLVSVTNTETAIGTALAGTLIIVAVDRVPASLALLGASLIEKSRAADQLPEMFTADIGKLPEWGHILLATAAVRTWDDLDLLTEFLGTIPEERRNKLMASAQVREHLRIIVLRQMFDDQRQVDANAIHRLSAIEDRCHQLGLPLLGAHAATGRLVVYGEYEDDVEGVLRQGDSARQRFGHDSAAVAVIDAIIGQQLMLKKRSKEGLTLLSRALDEPDVFFGPERAERLVDAIRAAWDAGVDPAPFADELERLLDSSEIAVSEHACQMHAQVAVVRWHAGRQSDSFPHFERSFVKLLEMEESTRFRQLAQGLGYALTYCAHLAETGEPPPEAADGGPPVEPEPSIFSGTSSAMAEMWRERQGPVLLRLLLGRLAGALGLVEQARRWMDAAFDSAIEARVPTVISMVGPHAVIEALRARDWLSALEVSLIHGRTRVFVENTIQEGVDVIGEDLPFDPFSTPELPEDKSRAEMFSLWLLSRAIVIAFGPLAVDDAAQSRTATESLAGAIEQIAQAMEDPEPWQLVVQTLICYAAPHLSRGEHKSAVSGENENGEPARFVAHGLLAFRDDAITGQAAVSHVGIVQSLVRGESAFGVGVIECVNSIADHWMGAVSRARFQFRSPGELERLIGGAHAEPPIQRVRITLRGVLDSLAVKVTTEVREWLSEP